jgi:4'-phosphopantetheinyl transferase
MAKARSESRVSSEPATRSVESSTPPEPTLRNGAVHAWRADLNLEPARLSRLGQNLSEDEQARAARFHFDRDRERFIAARGLLREILALYLNTAAKRLRFRYGTHGKPSLAEGGDLRFNLSHSHDTMLVAVAQQREVGVDIEHAGADIAVEEIAETVFSTPEVQVLNRLEGETKRAAFLRFWTRKEAYIKADGRGVSLPLKRVDVSVPADRVAVLNESTGKWDACLRWVLRTLTVGPEHVAALAAEGQEWQLACWQWPDSRVHGPIPWHTYHQILPRSH